MHDIVLVNETEAKGVMLRSSLGRVAHASTDFDSDGRTGEAMRMRALTAEARTGVTLGSLEVASLDVVNHSGGDIALTVNAAQRSDVQQRADHRQRVDAAVGADLRRRRRRHRLAGQERLNHPRWRRGNVWLLGG